MHLNGLGIPIVDDPLYPQVQDIEIDDFSRPLQLLAAELAFTDPIDGAEREFRERPARCRCDASGVAARRWP